MSSSENWLCAMVEPFCHPFAPPPPPPRAFILTELLDACVALAHVVALAAALYLVFRRKLSGPGLAVALTIEVAPYAIVAVTLVTAALGAPRLALLSLITTLAFAINAARGSCDAALAILGDAPRSAYDGKVVWITGASQGLGEELALHLASLGAKLILSSRRLGALQAVCDACVDAGAKDARALVLDARADPSELRSRADKALAMSHLAKPRGGIDYVFHVAGGSQHAAAEDTDAEVDRDMFELNVLSAIAITKAALPSMLARKRGTICVVGSMAAKAPAPGQATYAATKAACAAFHHSLRGEVADRGVRVCVAHPGPIATGLGGQTRVVFGATLERSVDTGSGGNLAAMGSMGSMGSDAADAEDVVPVFDQEAEARMKKENAKRLDAGYVARKIAAGAALGLDEVVLARQPIMLLRNFLQFIPTVAHRVLCKVGPKRARAAREGTSMYELK